MLKVMHQPFSVYMSFLKPYAGREVVYVDGQNDGKLIVLEAGFKRMLGKINLDPQRLPGHERPEAPDHRCRHSQSTAQAKQNVGSRNEIRRVRRDDQTQTRKSKAARRR